MAQLSLQQPYLCRYYYGFNEYETVKQLQKELNEVTPSLKHRLEVDGYFGRLTEETVKEYQESRGLRIDGIVGPETINALNSRMSLKGSVKKADETLLGNKIESTTNREEYRIPESYTYDNDCTTGDIEEELFPLEPYLGDNGGLTHIPYVTSEGLCLPQNSKYVIARDRIWGTLPFSNIHLANIIEDLANNNPFANFVENIDELRDSIKGIKNNTYYQHDNYNAWYKKKIFPKNVHKELIVVRYFKEEIEVCKFLGQKIAQSTIIISKKQYQRNRRLMKKMLYELRIFLIRVVNRINFKKLFKDAGRIMRQLINFVQPFIVKVNSKSWIIKFLKKLAKRLRFIPLVRILSIAETVLPLIDKIIKKDYEGALEELFKIVEELVKAVVETAIVGALMMCGLGEIAIALLILYTLVEFIIDDFSSCEFKLSL